MSSVPGPAPAPAVPVTEEKKLGSGPGLPASNVGQVRPSSPGPRTPYLFGKGLGQTFSKDGSESMSFRGRERAGSQSLEDGSGTSLAFITFFSPSLFKNKTSFCSENKKLETCDKLPV